MTEGSELQDLAMLVNDEAGEMLIESVIDAKVLGAYVEDQVRAKDIFCRESWL